MFAKDDSVRPSAPPALLGWPRVRTALIASLAVGMLEGLTSLTATWIVVCRTLLVGFAALLAFGLMERWPRRLPSWMARWALQVMLIGAIIPFAAYLAYWLSYGGHPNLGQDELRLAGYAELSVIGVLFAPWIAVGALVKQRDTFARDQASAFSRERSDLERKASDARMRLLQAQVQPHFLFNTLANVQELVDTGAPQAAQVLRSLVEYLRAAVPRLHETATTLGQELQLVRAYLDIMHMRMPDRLKFEITLDAAARDLQCPPMSVLTLVENAVRHGIDPSEVGGSILIEVRREKDRCRVQVSDTGVGLQPGGRGLGTGLASLRERLELSFGGNTELRLSDITPHGVRAEMAFPARESLL